MSLIEKIGQLSDAQRTAMDSYRAAWLAHGRSTEPSDRSTAERVWRAMYAALGKPPPVVLWFDGPATATLARDAVLPLIMGRSEGQRASPPAVLASGLGANLGIAFRDELWVNLQQKLTASLNLHIGEGLLRELRGTLEGHLMTQLQDNLADHLKPTLGSDHWVSPTSHQIFDWSYGPPDFYPASLWDDLSDDVWAHLWANLAASLSRNLGIRLEDGTQIRASLRQLVGNTWTYWHSGQHAAWRAFYLWPHVALRPMHAREELRLLVCWLALARSTGWWEPFEHAVIACERPLRQAVDERGRLHHATGPALLCRDGWPVHALSGVRVPDYVVERPHQDISIAKIDAQPNAEVRRVMIDRFGIDRYVAESGFKRVHADDFGVLYRRRNRDGRILAVARVVDAVKNDDGSPKAHFLWVNSELRPMRLNEATGTIEYGEPQALTARNAVASTFGLRGEEYNPAVQT